MRISPTNVSRKPVASQSWKSVEAKGSYRGTRKSWMCSDSARRQTRLVSQSKDRSLTTSAPPPGNKRDPGKTNSEAARELTLPGQLSLMRSTVGSKSVLPDHLSLRNCCIFVVTRRKALILFRISFKIAVGIVLASLRYEPCPREDLPSIPRRRGSGLLAAAFAAAAIHGGLSSLSLGAHLVQVLSLNGK